MDEAVYPNRPETSSTPGPSAKKLMISWLDTTPLRRYKEANIQRSGSLWFFDLPAEIRNMIYYFTLSMGTIKVPRPTDPETGRHTGFDLLETCSQISHEAATLFIQKGRAYIPVTSTLDLQQILRRYNDGLPKMIQPFERTILFALSNIRSLRLQLHVAKLELASDSNLLLNLLRIIRSIAPNSSFGDGTPKWGDKKREVLVHLDHYFADSWEFEIPQSRCNLRNILVTMRKAIDVQWTVAYYLHTGHENDKVMDQLWHDNRVLDHTQTSLLCDQGSNIKVVYEKPGLGIWDREAVPDRCMKSAELDDKSDVWPSYPKSLSGFDKQIERKKIRAQELPFSRFPPFSGYPNYGLMYR